MMLKLTDVVSGYTDLDIVRGVSMEVRKGEIVTLIGPNGSGKSTLLKTIFGLVRLRSGKIEFNGAEISRLRTDKIVRRGMGYVPQERNVFPSLTVMENLEMGAFTQRHKFMEGLEEVLTVFPELRDKGGQRVGTMSGGEQKMVAICRAMILKPTLLLLDEPSSGLSPKLIDNLFKKLLSINELGTSLVIVEQNAKKSLAMSHRGYVLDMGRIRFEGEGKSLLTNEEVRALYLGG
ncbi:MAG: ABC transporter ATP-binding protein [Candidatus Methanospirareceae archaeon]